MNEKRGRQPDRQKFCTGCGEQLQPEYEFCPYCGEKRVNAPADSFAGSKVTPISPEARKMLEDFENQFEQMRRKRAEKTFLRSRTKESDIKILIIIGSAAFVFLLLVCIYFSRQLTALTSSGPAF
jgi:uncharacterized membrane protein YvbJ